MTRSHSAEPDPSSRLDLLSRLGGAGPAATGLRRYAVIAFQTIASQPAGHVEERGGGICFVPVEDRAEWPAAVESIVREYFRRPQGRSLEIGIASLDEALLAAICHRLGRVYWQGGDS